MSPRPPVLGSPGDSPERTTRPRQTSRWWGIVGGTVFGVAALLGSWFYLKDADQRISATTTGYKVLSDTSVRVEFDVTRPLEQPVTCTVTAQDSRFADVGRVQVVIPVGTAVTTHHIAMVRTASHAVTGNVTDCVRTH